MSPSIWQIADAKMADFDREREAIACLPSTLRWTATLHYYAFIHGRQAPARVLIVRTWNWQLGEHVYFVPVPYETDLKVLRYRHGRENDDADMVAIYELHWHEFTRLFPPPDRDALALARQGVVLQ